MLVWIAALTPLALPQTCGSDPDVERIGLGTLGTSGTPRLVLEGAPLVGNPVQLEVNDALPGAVGALFLGFAETALAFPAYGATAFVAPPLVPSPFVVEPDGTSQALLALGSVTPTLCGAEAFVQAIVIDAGAIGGVAFTDALRVAFGGASERPIFPVVAADSTIFASAIWVGDLDGDQAAEVVLSSDTTGVSLFQGIPGGGLGPETALDFSMSSIRGVDSADVDHDGIADLVAWGEDGVSTLLGTGGGAFGSAVVSAVGGGAYSALIDVDLDGEVDVARFDSPYSATAAEVLVYRGLGGGAFAPAVASILGTAPSYIAIAFDEFTGDGIPDLVYGESGAIVLARGLGDGTFTADPPVVLSGLDSVRGLTAANLNGDAARDVVVTTHADEVVSFLGTGGGGFVEVESVPVATFGTLRAPVAGDLDADGDDEVVLSDDAQDTTEVLVLEGLGDGTLGPAEGAIAVEKPFAMRIVDVDADAKLDVVVLGASRDASLLFGEGDGSLVAPRVLEGVAGASGIVIADLDGDMIAELVLRDHSADELAVAPGLGDGQFGAATAHATGMDPVELVLVDLNGDHALDAVTANQQSDDVSVLLGLGDGSFGPAQSFAAGPEPCALVAADFNGDGFADVGVGQDPPAGTGVMLFGQGDGTLGAPVPLPLTHSVLDRGMRAADVDLDGALDIVSTQTSSGGTVLLLGAGDGTFGTSQQISSLTGEIDVIDLGADGLPDVVIGRGAGAYEGVLYVHTGQGAGNFLQTQHFNMKRDPAGLVTGDLDGDLIVDVLVLGANPGGSLFDLYRGSGSGSIDPAATFYALAGALALGDVTGDLIDDVVVSTWSTGVAVWESQLLR